jgi:hypothetical protein
MVMSFIDAHRKDLHRIKVERMGFSIGPDPSEPFQRLRGGGGEGQKRDIGLRTAGRARL